MGQYTINDDSQVYITHEGIITSHERQNLLSSLSTAVHFGLPGDSQATPLETCAPTAALTMEWAQYLSVLCSYQQHFSKFFGMLNDSYCQQCSTTNTSKSKICNSSPRWPSIWPFKGPQYKPFQTAFLRHRSISTLWGMTHACTWLFTLQWTALNPVLLSVADKYGPTARWYECYYVTWWKISSGGI